MELKIEVNGCARPGANTPARALGDHKLCHIVVPAGVPSLFV